VSGEAKLGRKPRLTACCVGRPPCPKFGSSCHHTTNALGTQNHNVGDSSLSELDTEIECRIEQYVVKARTLHLQTEPDATLVATVWFKASSVTPLNPYAPMTMEGLGEDCCSDAEMFEDRLDARMQRFAGLRLVALANSNHQDL
jgi:hypothetical protein